MKKAILATKVGMTQIFNEDGVLIPVTVLQAGPCVVTQIKTVENDGYSAVQVGFGDKREKSGERVKEKHTDMVLKKLSLTKLVFQERDLLENSNLKMLMSMKLAQEIKADIFAAG